MRRFLSKGVMAEKDVSVSVGRNTFPKEDQMVGMVETVVVLFF